MTTPALWFWPCALAVCTPLAVICCPHPHSQGLLSCVSSSPLSRQDPGALRCVLGGSTPLRNYLCSPASSLPPPPLAAVFLSCTHLPISTFPSNLSTVPHPVGLS